MSAKISAARRAHFLKIVAETGNQTIAVERAKVSRSWVTLHRATDPAFDAAVREALAESQRRLGEHPLPAQAPIKSGSESPVSGGPCPAGSRDCRGQSRPETPVEGKGKKRARYHQGYELIIRGTRSGRAGANKRLVQIGRARVRQWTARAEDRFLEALSRTANVKAACAAVGLSPASAYNHRDRRPDFERRWRETLNIAHIRIEMAFIEQAAAMIEPGGVPCDGPIREMTASEALYLLEMHKRREAGERNRPGRWRWKQPPIEQVIETIRQRAAAIRAARPYRDGGSGTGAVTE